MAPAGFVRRNAFLVAAVALPLIVVALFAAASAIPRVQVPPPGYDLVLRADRPYEQWPSAVAVDFAVREGRVVAVVRAVPGTSYAPRRGLLLFDHRAGEVREVPVDIPERVTEEASPLTVPVEALAARRVLDQTKAPDGYEFDTRVQRGPGIVGEIFGMRGSDRRPALIRDGRVVPLTLPAAYPHAYGVQPLGWIVE